MRPYSLDLRERILAAVDHHDGSIRWIAQIFRVSTSFFVRLLPRRRAADTVAPKPHRGGRPRRSWQWQDRPGSRLPHRRLGDAESDCAFHTSYS